MFLVGCSTDDAVESLPTMNQEEFKVIAADLEIPWEIVKHNDVIYVSERPGAIVEVHSSHVERIPVQLEKELSKQPEAGLLGIALPPDFSDTAYAYYSCVENNEYYQRVAKIKRKENHWEETSVILDKIPGGKYHQGGRIEIGPDQKLYVTTGDATSPELAQDLTSLAGKILRINLNGTVPSDNPFKGNYIYSYGHRNPQGITWDGNGKLYATEHGQSAHDELNLIEKGRNYGWPIIQGNETHEGMEVPIIHSNDQTWAPSGLAFLGDRLYFSALRGEGVRVYNLKTGELDAFLTELGRVRDVLATDEGLYVITNNTDGRGNPEDEDDRLILVPPLE
ncbi:PQQ-dependent sugar dehydrogenase [Ornithinibacillus halotolerans]|nr:PQQ-dependent sugar dehydrogenase [Ornithinibacillus halotolerans]